MMKNSQRLAWATLLIAFVVFCGVCIGSGWLVQYVLFDWSIDLESTVYVSRGTIGVQSPNEVGERGFRALTAVDAQDVISTDEAAQGIVAFEDPFNANIVIATVELFPSSSLRLGHANRPRFLGDAPLSILLTDVTGDFQIVVSTRLDRDVRVEVESNGYKVRLDRGGHYEVTADIDVMRVAVTRGEALIVDNTNHAQLVKRDQIGEANADGVFVSSDPKVDLVENSQFEDAGAGVPVRWGCTSTSDDPSEPSGIYEGIYYQDRPVLHIDRVTERPVGHGETGCVQRIDEDDQDVSQYSSVVIRATMYLDFHSLNGCGVAASECPLMLQVNYRNRLNVDIPRQWIRGFYVDYDERIGGFPIRCNSCVEDHIHVNGKTWFTFESENLISDVPEWQDLNPVRIESIRFYASGHQYEVYVGEVSIIAR